MMRKEAKIGVLLVFAVFLWYLLAQYSSVYIYYDDYGYLSLSYGYRVQGVTGLGYTPAQMLEFVQGHYASGSSGRLLYMLIFLTVYMLAGLRGVQVFMALAAEAVLVLSFMLAWRFLDKKPEKGLASLAVPVLMAAVPGILFGLIGVIVQRSGSYWYAASFLYVVPAIAFCLFAMAYYRTAVEEEESRTWKKAGCAVLAFLAAFSQEQWMVAAVVLAAGVMVLRRLSGKRLRGWDWCTLAAAVAGTLPILTSPGAERRLQQHTWFLEMSWPERIVMNIGLITRTFFSSDNQLYTLFLLMAVGCLGVYMAARRIGPLWENLAFTAATAAAALYLAVQVNIRIVAPNQYSAAAVWLLFVYILWMMGQLLFFQFRQGNRMQGLVVLAAFFSMACLTVVPELPSRVVLPFVFLSMPLVCGLLGQMLAGRAGEAVLAAAVLAAGAAVSCHNMQNIYRGYKANELVMRYNDAALWQASRKIQEGGEAEPVRLYRLLDNLCAGDMAYDPNFSYMTYWMECYYGLPSGIPLDYQTVQDMGELTVPEGDQAGAGEGGA